MPAVELIFNARTDGSVATSTAQVNQALQQIKQNAVQVTREIAAANPLMPQSGIGREFTGKDNPYAVAAAQIKQQQTALDKYRGSADQTEMSQRKLKEAIRNTTMAFGNVSPELMLVSVALSNIREEMSGVSLASKAAAMGTIGIGLAVAAVVSNFERLEEKARVLAEIRRAAGTFDIGALQTGAGATAVGIETTVRRLDSPIGALIEGVKNIPNTLETAWNFWSGNGKGPTKTTLEEQQERLEQYRDAIKQLQPYVQDLDRAQASARLTAAGSAEIQQTLQAAMQFGTARPTDVATASAAMQRASGSRYAAERAALALEERKALAEAEARGTKDIEEPTIKARYADRLKLLSTEERQEAETIGRLRLEGLRTLAAQELSQQESILKESLSRRQAAAEIAVSAGAAIRHAGDTTYLGSLDASQRAQMGLSTEYAGTAADLAATQAASAARVAEIERTQTQLKAVMQGYRAQDLISEREYADKVRGMDQELTQAKMQGLQQYSQALASALGKAASDYAKYTEEVRGLEKSIRATKQDTADAVAAIKQAGMTPAEVTADREKRAADALTAAMKLSGQEQIDALKKVQTEYASLGVAAAQAAQAQKDAAKQTADTFTLAGDAWRTTPGQHSEAYNKAWNSPSSGGPNSIGNNSGTAAPAYMNTGAAAYMDSLSGMPFGITRAQIAAREAERTALENVKKAGDLIVTAEERQLQAAKDNATQAERMVGSLTTAANEAARLAQALASANPSSNPAPGGPSKQQGASEKAAELVKAVDAFMSGATTETPWITPSQINGVSRASIDSYDQAMMSGGGGDMPAAAGGGIVRRTGAALVHQGEVILNEGQQRQMGNQYSFSIVVQGGANVSDLDRATVRKLVREEIIPEIERVQDAG
jgi:hypothetical protein